MITHSTIVNDMFMTLFILIIAFISLVFFPFKYMKNTHYLALLNEVKMYLNYVYVLEQIFTPFL